jgi:predicted N-acetyltransferase YhbS
MSLLIRQLNVDEIEDVLRVQEKCYSFDLLERRECFVHKYNLFPTGCLGVFLNHQLIGYIFFHPWMLNHTVPLDDTTYVLPANSDCLYIHDLAILPDHRHAKVGAQLIDQVVLISQELSLMSYALIAVQNSESYWTRWGFESNRPMKYGNGAATYMICKGTPKWKS